MTCRRCDEHDLDQLQAMLTECAGRRPEGVVVTPGDVSYDLEASAGPITYFYVVRDREDLEFAGLNLSPVELISTSDRDDEVAEAWPAFAATVAVHLLAFEYLLSVTVDLIREGRSCDQVHPPLDHAEDELHIEVLL